MMLPSGVVPEFAGLRHQSRKLARLLDADADGVNFRADRGGDLRGGHGINVALVVVAIGQQNDDAALGCP